MDQLQDLGVVGTQGGFDVLNAGSDDVLNGETNDFDLSQFKLLHDSIFPFLIFINHRLGLPPDVD